jgi:hypothetical protein
MNATQTAQTATVATSRRARRGRGARSLGTIHCVLDGFPLYRAPKAARNEVNRRRIDGYLGRVGGRHQADVVRMDRRIAECGTYVPDSTYQVDLYMHGKRARWHGVAHCASWDCPRCARRKADKAAGRLAQCLEGTRKLGWAPYLVTLTMPHKPTDTLRRCMRAAREGWKVTRRKLSDTGYVRGMVAAYETTLGKSGWHVHVHAIVWTDSDLTSRWDWWTSKVDEVYGVRELELQLRNLKARKTDTATQRFKKRDEVFFAEEELRAARAQVCKTGMGRSDLWAFEYMISTTWAEGVAKTGMARPDWRRQDVRRAKDTQGTGDQADVVRYILKTAYELAGAGYKTGRGDSFTPAEILSSAAGGCSEGRRAWEEYRLAMVGVHRVQGIAALEKKLEKESATVAPEPREEPHLIARVQRPAWYSCRRITYDRLLVRVAELGDPLDAARIVGKAGPYAMARDWRRAAAETLGPQRLVGECGGSWSDCDGTSVELEARSLRRFIEKWSGAWDEIPLQWAA